MNAKGLAGRCVAAQRFPGTARGEICGLVRARVRAGGVGEDIMAAVGGQRQGPLEAAAAVGQALEVVELGGWLLYEGPRTSTGIDVALVETVEFEKLGLERQWGIGYVDEGRQLQVEDPWFEDLSEARKHLDELNASCRICDLGWRYELAYRFVRQPHRAGVEVGR